MAFAMQKCAAPRSSFAGQSLVVRQQTARAQARVAPSAAASEPSWLPGSKAPAHLSSKQAGNFGFDPLGLGSDPAALAWYTQAELIHCRTAMAGVAGILIPAVLTKAGLLSVPAWYDAGKINDANNGIPFNALLWVQFVLTHFVETKRWQDIKKKGSQGEKGSFLGFEGALAGTDEVGYPGGIFDPLGLASGPKEVFEEYKLKELKNGRLAMLAFLGFAAQYVATGKDPIENLADHVSSPWAANFATNGVSLPTNFPFGGTILAEQ